VQWYEAAEYCNWLSKQEGLPETEWCYQPNKDRQYGEGMKLAPGYLKRTGDRLPTEAEWEYACRAGAATSRYDGDSEEVLGKYGWYAGNSDHRSWPVGSLKPNDLGLFDMHGNVWCWCQEDNEAQGWKEIEGNADSVTVNSLDDRVLRSGSFNHPPVYVRTAHRIKNRPGLVSHVFGFRVARTFRSARPLPLPFIFTSKVTGRVLHLQPAKMRFQGLFQRGSPGQGWGHGR
jgi:formylglycine-generating enzyme required for sulfatase activity